MELKAKLVSAGLLMYWIALNSCTRRKREKEGRKRERETERKREEADELGLMELKAKLVSAGLLMYWNAWNSCTRRKRKKQGRKREREKEKERRGRWVRTYGASSRPSLYPVELLLYWAALNTCTNPEESGKKESRGREKERERRGRWARTYGAQG